jgi:hypothetical protein
MKKIISNIYITSSLLFLAFAVTVSSCTKDSDGSPGYKAGNPTFTAISPDSASGGTVITLTGSGLGDMRSIVFDNNSVPAAFYTTLNTETAIVFRVPDTAYGGPQNIVFTNSEGKTLSVPFKVLAYPNVSTAFPTDFQAGTQVTLSGNNLDDVSSVVLEGTSDAATIVSKTKKQLVIQMPASSATRANLVITNASGTITTSQEFVNVSQAATVFSDQLDNGFQSWSWGGTFNASSDDKITGAASMKAAYDPAGSWGGMQLGGGYINLSGYKYFSFWVKGADADKNVQFWLNWGNVKVVTVPANKWTYFRYELAVDYPGVSDVNNVTFQIFDAGKTLYFDNIMFSK